MNTIFKKMTAMLLATVMCMGLMLPTQVFAQEINNANNLEELDVIIASAIRLNSTNPEDDILKDNSTVEKIVPLYDSDFQIIAYYITYKPTGYAVVNNNLENSSLIEFGSGKSSIIENEIELGGRVVYSHPDKAITDRSMTESVSSLADYYPDLSQPDYRVKSEHLAIKNEVLDTVSNRGNGDYGFVDWGNLPGGSSSSSTILRASNVDWITTGEVDDIANNHCGATAVTNIALYYATRGNSNLKISNSNRSTFESVHSIVGDGPVMTIADKASRYFSNRGYSLGYSGAGSFAEIKTAVHNNQITGILLADGIVSWHWILGVGYREYTSGEKFIQIVNGWDDTIYKYYKPHTGSMWISATKYLVK